MTASSTSSPPFAFNYRSPAKTSGLRNSPPPSLPSYWVPSSIAPFDFSPDSDPSSQTTRSTEPPWSFQKFIPDAWTIIEPGTPFIGGYHVDAIAEHLQAISNGDLQNLIINIPPRHTKSSLVCVLWPAWEWTVAPHLQWLFASYREALAIRDSVKMRRLIQSSWYQERWGSLYRLTGDQNEKRRFENDRSGYRVSLGVGSGTGEGGHRLVLDDPISADQAESDAYRESANDWVDGTFSTRGNDPRTVARVIVMQRLHEQDTTGHLLEKQAAGGHTYDHLILPAEYEPTVQFCVADLQHDPRTEPGDLLSPDRFGPKELSQLKASLGEMGTAGQLQQRPAPAGGAVFKREWWETDTTRYHVETPVMADARWLSLDTAFKDGEENDYTACLCLELLTDGRFRVREVWREKLTFPQLVPAIVSSATRWNQDGKLQAVAVEDKGSGQSAVQVLRSSAPDWLARRVVATPGKHSKTYRARAASLWCAQGLLLLPHPSTEAPWLFEFESELYKFPTAAHDDQVDALSQIIIELDAYFRRSQRARQTKAEAA
jgi:predicted phage terminase large subunit-like protein